MIEGRARFYGIIYDWSRSFLRFLGAHARSHAPETRSARANPW